MCLFDEIEPKAQAMLWLVLPPLLPSGAVEKAAEAGQRHAAIDWHADGTLLVCARNSAAVIVRM